MKNSRKKAYQEEIKRVIGLLVAKYQPEKIILFGSAAKGKSGGDSDIDLPVVANSSKNYRQRAQEAVLLCASYIPKDIFVLTPKELDQAIAENRFLITEEVLPKGKVLYEKSD